jgi:sulfate transport system permease protein
MSKKKHLLPGLGLSLGISLTYLSLMVLIPFTALFWRSHELGLAGIWNVVTQPRVLASYKLSFGASLIAAAVNAVLGLVVAWVLARYEFPGRKLMDALVDLPFALPTAVAGIALTTLFVPNGWIGRFTEPLGIHLAFTPLGITLALIFIGLPFAVRTLQPVLENLDPDIEEAAACLGADRWTTFKRVIFPSLIPAWLTGIAMSFARAVGEYGSIAFVSGNMPMKTEIAPLLIITKLEQYDYAGATAIATVMLLVSFLLMLSINALQLYSRKGQA